MKRFLNLSVVAIVAVALLSCGKDDPAGPNTTGTIRVLFVGNSLTYTNDLPAMVGRVAAAIGAHIETESMAYPNYALIDHWNEGFVQERIRTGNFDYVVLQQGPSSLPLNRDTLRLATALFNPVIRASGARPALFAVWPEVERFGVFPDVAESYYLAAQDVGGVYLPVGNTWLYTFDNQPDAPLYGSDGYHPGVAGTYAAAAVMVATFTARDAETLSLDVPGLTIDRSLMSTIHTAAHVAMAGNTLLPR